MRTLIVWLACVCAALTATRASAQDLFELEVFQFDSAAPGAFEVEIHTNVMSRGGVAADSAASNHRPAHVSIEMTRGWSNRFETAVFLQTAPFGRAGSAWFAGGHVRGKAQLGTFAAVPLRVALGAEYAFNRAVFDREMQTFEIRSILDYGRGRLSLVANPTLEVVTRGSDEGLDPVFDMSARAGWRLVDQVELAVDYFSAAATTRHLPETDGHHLLFGGMDINIAPRWEVGVGAGHCVTRGEPWLLKSIIGFAF
jgi:hypothetical protein